MAVGQVVGQIWDGFGHLRLSTGGPVAWTLITIGIIGPPLVLWVEARRVRRPIDESATPRRAA